MKLFNNIIELRKELDLYRTNKQSIGFVPTMGALHQGHLSLVKSAKNENDICVCSIFVNPTQFNNPKDLEKYPRDIEADIKLLESVNCDILFYPDVEEMYPQNEEIIKFDFGLLEKVMEGTDRPGHFQGVGIVVKKLFEITEPDNAYFGKKDYQQLLVIKSLTKQYNLSPKIIGCDIVREKDGLAMSSRNQRLTAMQRESAPHIYATLKLAKENARKMEVDKLKNWIKQKINSNKLMKLSYFEVSDAETLESLDVWESNKKAMGFIVVEMGDVRLIDNVDL